MFNFHVVTELHSPTDDDSSDSLVQWQCFDGARPTFQAARMACDEFVVAMPEGWTLDVMSVWPDDTEADDAVDVPSYAEQAEARRQAVAAADD